MFRRSLRAITSQPRLKFHSFTSAQDHALQLLDEFSKPKNHRNPTKLYTLGLGLTPNTVESVLKGLRGWRTAQEFFTWAGSQPQYRHNSYTCNTFASILARAKKDVELRKLADGLVSGGCAMSMSPGALGFFLRCLGSLGLVQQAQIVFDNAQSFGCVPNVYTYNCLFEVFAKAGRVDLLELRLREMQSRAGVQPDKFTYTYLLQCYCNVNRLDDAMEVLGRIESNGWVDSHVLTILLYAFCKQGRVDKAQKLFERMKDLNFVGDLPLYGALIEGLCEKKEVLAALKLFEGMKSKGIVPNIKLIRKLVSILCEKGDLEAACKLFTESVKGLNLKSGSIVSICNAVLEVLVNSDQITRAYCLLKVMINPEDLDECKNDLDQQLVNIVEGVKPNDDTFNTVICGLCKHKKLDIALNLVNDMTMFGCKGKLLMYNNLIDELCKADRLEESYNLFEKMKQLHISPTEFTHNSLFYGHGRRNDTSGALVLIREMHAHGHVPWIKHCTMLVKHLCLSGRTEDASMFLIEMHKLGFLPDMIPYSAVIDGLCKSGHVDKGMELFEELCNRNYVLDVVAHNILINGLLKSGNWEKAEEALEEMLNRGLSPSVVTYNLMIDGLFKANNPEKALSFFHKMSTEEILFPNVITYTSLIDGLMGARKPEAVMDIWNDMKKNGVIPNKIIYTALVHGFSRCGLAERALGFYYEMKEKGFEIDIYGRFLLVNGLILERMPVKAFDLLNEFFCERDERVPFSANSKTTELVERAVWKLYRDESTSELMRNVVERGLIPTIRSVREIDNMS